MANFDSVIVKGNLDVYNGCLNTPVFYLHKIALSPAVNDYVAVFSIYNSSSHPMTFGELVTWMQTMPIAYMRFIVGLITQPDYDGTQSVLSGYIKSVSMANIQVQAWQSGSRVSWTFTDCSDTVYPVQ